jgi:hypothetical protein
MSTPCETSTMKWADLTSREKNVLEHLANIRSGAAQVLTIRPNEQVLVRRADGSDTDRILGTPMPTENEIARMRAFCRANTLLDDRPDLLLVRGLTL